MALLVPNWRRFEETQVTFGTISKTIWCLRQNCKGKTPMMACRCLSTKRSCRYVIGGVSSDETLRFWEYGEFSGELSMYLKCLCGSNSNIKFSQRNIYSLRCNISATRNIEGFDNKHFLISRNYISLLLRSALPKPTNKFPPKCVQRTIYQSFIPLRSVTKKVTQISKSEVIKTISCYLTSYRSN
jgi:hypothetical protein